LRESARTERRRGNSDSITGKEQNSEGRSPRALGAERGFQGFGELGKAMERVAKPWAWNFREAEQNLFGRFFK
jgi:hypothetical protein